MPYSLKICKHCQESFAPTTGKQYYCRPCRTGGKIKCKVEGCVNEESGRGYCKSHFHQFKYYGKIISVIPLRVGAPREERFTAICKVCKIQVVEILEREIGKAKLCESCLKESRKKI